MRKALFVAILAASACSKPADPTAAASTEAPKSTTTPAATRAPGPASAATVVANRRSDPLPERLDCLRQTGGLLLIGHRGGPTRDFPENSVETFERTLKAGTPSVEMDVTATKDGKLVLMHDEDLDRTTTGTGPVRDKTWEEIAKLNLETYSRETKYHPNTLYEGLAWAVGKGVVVEVDKKRDTSFDLIISDIRAAKAENHVFVITYTDDQAVEVHQKAPELVITATIKDEAQVDSLLARGVKADRLLAWTGTETPNPVLWKALAARGIEPIFGTLGGRDSLDKKYWADGDGSEFTDLAKDLPILVVDLTDKASRQLSGEIAKARSCGF